MQDPTLTRAEVRHVVGPYVLFLGFPSAHSPALVGWTKFRTSIDRGAGLVTSLETRHGRADLQTATEDHRVGVWRLLAPNNREVARCAYIYGSFSSARSNAIHIQDELDEVSIVTIHGPTPGTHGWFAALDGSIVFTCSRWYETSSLSIEAGEGAVEAFRTAKISELPRFISTQGSRSDDGSSAW